MGQNRQVLIDFFCHWDNDQIFNINVSLFVHKATNYSVFSNEKWLPLLKSVLSYSTEFITPFTKCILYNLHFPEFIMDGEMNKEDSDMGHITVQNYLVWRYLNIYQEEKWYKPSLDNLIVSVKYFKMLMFWYNTFTF